MGRNRIATGAAALALLLAGCAAGADGPTEDAPGAEASVPTSEGLSGTLTYWHAYNADSAELETLEEVVIPAFEAEHPGVTVESVPMPWDELRSKLVTAVAGDALPDLVRADLGWIAELADLGALVPLSEDMPDFDEIAASVYPGPLATNLWREEYYGLPLNTNTRVLMYNAEVLAAAGVDAPPATFEELREAAVALAENDVAVFADNSTAGWNVLPWIWSAGGDVTDEGVTVASGYIDSPESIAGVQLLVDLYQAGSIPDVMLGVEGGTNPSDGVVNGSYATMLDGPWMFPILAGQFPDFDLQAVPVPAGDGGSVSVVGGESIVLTQASENKEAAMEFMRFLLQEESQLAFAEVGQIPVLASLGDRLTEIQDYYAVFAEQLASTKPRPPHPAWAAMEEVLKREVALAMTGEKSAEDAMATTAAEMDALLAQYAG